MDKNNDNTEIRLVPLGILCEKIRGVSYTKGEAIDTPMEGYIPLLRANNIDNDELNYEDIVYVPKNRISDKQLLKKGDVVIAMSSGSKKVVGKGAQLKTNWEGSFGAFCGVLRPNNDALNKEYFGYFFGSASYRNYISSVSAGTNINNLKNEHFDNITFPLPPLPQQEQIVARFNDFIPKIKVSRQGIIKARALTKRFRHSIITSAITGSLSEEWREKNLNLPKSYISYVNEKHKPKVQFGLSQFETYDLPEGWKWKQFWEVAEIKSNLVEPDKYPDYVLVAPDNIERNTGRLLEKKLVKEIKPISAKHLFFSGQIVYSKIRPYLSKLILADFDGLCSADMYPISARINVKYLMLYMLSRYFLDNVSNLGTRTLLPKTNQEELNSLPIPIPPLEEQEEIIKKVDFYLGIASKIEKQIEVADRKVSKLTQAILAKTFNLEF